MTEEQTMNVEEQLITLIKGVADLGSKVEDVRKSVEEMKETSKTVNAHATRIGQIEESLKRGAQKFDKIDSALEKLDGRIDTLEKAEGEKAKATISTVAKYVLVAVVGAILSSAPIIINNLGG